jgi:hypothetical protein
MNTPSNPRIPSLEFRQEGVFFPFVGSFLTAIASLPAITDPANPLQFRPEDSIELQGVVTQPRSIKPFEIHRNVIDGHLQHDYYCANLCIMLANTAYEAAKPYNDQSPVFEFFRHIRNAGSHGNRFYFTAREPVQPAIWRTAVIDHTIKGTSNPLYDTACFGLFLGFVDILELLWDVEQLILAERRSRKGAL